MTPSVSCEIVRPELSNYVDEMLDASVAALVEKHLGECKHCRSLLDGMSNTVRLVGDARLLQPPAGFSKRLYSKIEGYESRPQRVAPAPDEVSIGITENVVPVGSHLIYFWQSNAEFESGVRFLYPGLGKDEHCVIFGHAEALHRVHEVLQEHGYDPEALKRDRKLTVLLRHAKAETTLAEISAAVEAAIADGASMVRFLGNLGIGLAPLPAGEDDVLELESKVTGLLSQLPCVVVCMYDVRTVPGRLLFKGGLETHPLSVCGDGVRENPFYAGGDEKGHSHIVQ